MGDIAALKIIGAQIDAFRKLPNPPNTDADFEAYKSKVEKTKQNAIKCVEDVAGYVNQIHNKLQDLKKCIPDLIARLQEAIKARFGRLAEMRHDLGQAGRHDLGQAGTAMGHDGKRSGHVSSNVLADLEEAQKLEKLAKALMETRLNDLVAETETTIAKVKIESILTKEDIDNLKGCLESWQTLKEESFAEEKRRIEEEQKRKEEMQRREDQERREREEEEQKRKEEDERRKREEEERLRKREEERLRKEERERKKREEEERNRKKAEEKKKREDKERLRMEEEERLRKEERKRKKEEEDERKRKEAEERKKREEEERLRKEEEERLRQEEEERLKREEEERIKREEEERLKREAEEKRQREEEERKRNEDAERKRKEEERLRKEAEKRERDRKKREEEEKRRRLDPNNWDSHVYQRDGDDQVSGRKPFHGGVCCMVTSPPGEVKQEELQCFASDELDDVIEILDDGEKPASSVISVKSKKGPISVTDVPARVYIPHCQPPTSSEELVAKVRINGSDWVTSDVVQPTPNVIEKDKGGLTISNIIGIEMNDFEDVQVMVVARPKGQTVIVDKPGLNFSSITDKNVKLFIPRDTFRERTAVRLVVQPIPRDTIASNAQAGDGLFESIMSTSSMITITCERAPVKDFEVDIARNPPTTGNATKTQRGKLYHLFANKDKVWKFADVEYKSQNEVVSVTLHAHKNKYNLFELELPANISKDKAIKIAQVFQEQMGKTPVRVIVKQNLGHPQDFVMMLPRHKHVTKYVDKLKDEGFEIGPDVSKEFSLRDGQKLYLTCCGNIELTNAKNDKMKFTFYTYMNTVRKNFRINVQDMYKQKDLPEFIGTVRVTVDNGTEFPDEFYDLTIALPKPERPKTAVSTKRVRFPYYLTSFAGFLSYALCETEGVDWKATVGSIIGDQELKVGIRQAKRKVDEHNNKDLCRTILCDWMKATPRQEDKVKPILKTLWKLRLPDIVQRAEAFVKYQKGHLSDKILEGIARKTTKEFDVLAVDLRLDAETIANLRKERVRTTKDKIMLLLYEWRESEEVVIHGDRALEVLKLTCGVVSEAE